MTGLTPWAQSVYDRPVATGRGVMAIKRNPGLILLLVQEHSAFYSTNAMSMRDLRDLLDRRVLVGVDADGGRDLEGLLGLPGEHGRRTDDVATVERLEKKS